MGRQKKKNRFYAFDNGVDRGIVDSWPACEAKVKGRSARYRGFPDRASAEAWLAGDYSAGNQGRKKKYYAYAMEGGSGIVDSWEACEARVRGHSARYRGFPDRASAEAWLKGGAKYEDKAANKAAAVSEYPEDAVFFDAGTGRGRGTEVKVVDRDGTPLAFIGAELGGELTTEGTLLLGPSKTNNYGELLGCMIALMAAEQMSSRHIYGDSKLVLDYWSKGRVAREKRETDLDLARLARRTAAARRQFEAQGGSLAHVPGGINPADLGFHRDS